MRLLVMNFEFQNSIFTQEVQTAWNVTSRLTELASKLVKLSRLLIIGISNNGFKCEILRKLFKTLPLCKLTNVSIPLNKV